MNLPSKVLAEADFFFSYLTDDDLSLHSEKVVLAAGRGEIELYVCSEVYDELVSALRTGGASIDDVILFLNAMKIISHKPMLVTADLAYDALQLYKIYGGPRRLHYFDSFHVATARGYQLPLITSDEFIIEHKNEFNIDVMDLRKLI